MSNHKIFICDCHDVSHNLVISKDEDYMYVNLHMSPDLTLLAKLKYCFLFLIGKMPEYGAYAELMFNKEKTQELADYLTE